MSATRSKKQHKVEVLEESYSGAMLSFKEELLKRLHRANEAIGLVSLEVNAIMEELETLA